MEREKRQGVGAMRADGAVAARSGWTRWAKVGDDRAGPPVDERRRKRWERKDGPKWADVEAGWKGRSSLAERQDGLGRRKVWAQEKKRKRKGKEVSF